MSYLLCLTTVTTQKQARQLALNFLQKRLAACINIIPAAESHYRWEGKIEAAREVLLLIKTRKSLYAKLQKELLAKHPYRMPELIAVPISQGSSSYLKWLGRETTSRS